MGNRDIHTKKTKKTKKDAKKPLKEVSFTPSVPVEVLGKRRKGSPRAG